MGLRLFFSFLLFACTVPAQDLLQRYFEANAAQTAELRDVHMEMDFDARLPKLKKVGHMTGLRFVSSTGRVAFVVKSITGDDSVKKHVIARYLAGEQENSEKPMDVSISEKHYKFKYKRTIEQDGRQVQIFEVNPRKKRVGLYKGELWIDEETALPVREVGQFSKSPSPLFLKKVRFDRLYSIADRVSRPIRIESVIETRIAGKAEITINYSNFAPGGQPESAEPEVAASQPR